MRRHQYKNTRKSKGSGPRPGAHGLRSDRGEALSQKQALSNQLSGRKQKLLALQQAGLSVRSGGLKKLLYRLNRRPSEAVPEKSFWHWPSLLLLSTSMGLLAYLLLGTLTALVLGLIVGIVLAIFAYPA